MLMTRGYLYLFLSEESFINSCSLFNCFGLTFDSQHVVHFSSNRESDREWSPHLELTPFYPSSTCLPERFLWTQTRSCYSTAWQVLTTSCLKGTFEFLRARRTGSLSVPVAPTCLSKRNMSHFKYLMYVHMCNRGCICGHVFL